MPAGVLVRWIDSASAWLCSRSSATLTGSPHLHRRSALPFAAITSRPHSGQTPIILRVRGLRSTLAERPWCLDLLVAAVLAWFGGDEHCLKPSTFRLSWCLVSVPSIFSVEGFVFLR